MRMANFLYSKYVKAKLTCEGEDLRGAGICGDLSALTKGWRPLIMRTERRLHDMCLGNVA